MFGKVVLRSIDGYSTSSALAVMADGGVIKFVIANGENNTLDILPVNRNESNDYPYAYTFRLVVRRNAKNVITITPKMCAKFTKEFGRNGTESVIQMFLDNLSYRIIR